MIVRTVQTYLFLLGFKYLTSRNIGIRAVFQSLPFVCVYFSIFIHA